jgi:hypothetical protein
VANDTPSSALRRAFWNQYNLILLAGAGLFAATTESWLPLLVGGGLEALWMVLGADSPPFRRWAARQDEKEAAAAAEARAEAVLAQLDPSYAHRYRELAGVAQDIAAQAQKKPSLEARLVAPEVKKLVRLRLAFLDMAVLQQRLGDLLRQEDPEDLQRDIDEAQRALQKEKNSEVAAGLRQNLDLAQKRIKQDERMRSSFRLLDVKMDTLEKSFRYLQSNVVAGAGVDLSSELDDLITGVESVEEMQKELDALGSLAPLGAARAAAGQRAQAQ